MTTAPTNCPARPARRATAPAASLFLIAAAGVSVAHAATLEECRAMTDEASRLACYDQLDADAAAETQAPSPEAAPPTGAAVEAGASATLTAPAGVALGPTAAQLAAAFGAAHLPVDKRARDRADVEPEFLDVQVTKTRENLYGQLTLWLDNGQVWRQIDGKDLLLGRAGELPYSLTIRKGRVLDAYYMSGAHTRTSISVKRIR